MSQSIKGFLRDQELRGWNEVRLGGRRAVQEATRVGGKDLGVLGVGGIGVVIGLVAGVVMRGRGRRETWGPSAARGRDSMLRPVWWPIWQAVRPVVLAEAVRWLNVWIDRMRTQRTDSTYAGQATARWEGEGGHTKSSEASGEGRAE